MKNNQKVLIIGSGGREHAIAWKLAQSPRISKLYVAPGNGGTGEVAQNAAIDISDIPAVIAFAQREQLHLVVVTPDDPLAAGMVDALVTVGIRAFGPTKAAAQIESSKAFAKELMMENNIPTAGYRTFDDYGEALNHVKAAAFPLVIKASGLALGKGVYICKTLDEAETALREIMLDAKFGDAGNQVVIEDFLVGQEISIHAISDGVNVTLFPPSQDYKQIGEGDTGPNTGGMGVIAPVPWLGSDLIKRIESEVVNPALDGLTAVGSPFKGCLYPGLMIQDGKPSVVEFNARFGDPEAQVYMRLMENDLLDLIDASIDGKIADVNVRWSGGFAVCIAMASGGYPGSYSKGYEISGIDEAAKLKGIQIFHAGTTYKEGRLVTNGGRVLNVTSTGETLQAALDQAYAAIELINFQDMYYRRDIGWRVKTTE